MIGKPDGQFYREMFIRQRCGCLALDCVIHGSYDPDDLNRLEREGLLSNAKRKPAADVQQQKGKEQ